MIDRTAVWGHMLVLLASVAGVVGMGIVFRGTAHGDLHMVLQGTPFLVLGVWWSGHELGRSMLASRGRRVRGRAIK